MREAVGRGQRPRSQRRFSRSLAPLFAFGVFVLLGTMACSSMSSIGLPQEASESAPPVMTPERMEIIFSEQVDAIEGPPGAIRTQVDGINVYLVSDPANDRMRIIARIARLEQVGARVMPILLQANFHTTLDARYAVSDGVIYSIYLHPIASLTRDEIVSALAQVVSLVKTFGSTFSSGVLQFGVPEQER